MQKGSHITTGPTDRGDVREALIRAGTEMLDEQGNEPLTLRRIAARAGVSHGAPAHHFNGLPGLRTAIAMRGFQSFLATLTATRSQASGSDEDILIQVCEAYIRFAENRRGLFRLMFDELSISGPELGQEATHSYMILRELCRPFAQDGGSQQQEIAVWAMTHGYAAMELGRPRPPSAPFRPVPFGHLIHQLLNLPEDRTG